MLLFSVGDVEYKKEFHRVVVTKSPRSERNRTLVLGDLQRNNSLKLNVGSMGGGVGSINQQIGKQLLQQKKQSPSKQSKAATTGEEGEQPEKDPQENPTWYDFFVAMFFCIFGIIALVAGLLSLAAE